jgi:type 2 lantibiotic biosynthesis protein LanM
MNIIPSSFYRGANLPERLVGLTIDGSLAKETPDVSARLQQWLSISGLSLKQFLDARARGEGVGHGELVRVLAESEEELARRLEEQGWMKRLSDLLDQPERGQPDDEGSSVVELGWAAAAAPLFQAGRQRIRRVVEAVAAESGLGEALRPLLPSLDEWLLARLRRALEKTMVLEFQVARLEGRLPGKDAQADRQKFLEEFTDAARIRELLVEYPVLARHLVEEEQRWYDAGVEMVRRLASDWLVLREAYGGAEPWTAVKEAAMGLGDRHDHGRAVACLTFSNGVKVIYKPRSVAADAHFQQVVTWANEKGFSAPLRLRRVVDRSDYGWSEFIEQRDCADAEAVGRFFYRQGANLALFYALCGSDAHHENIIAHGEYPVMLDLETIVQPIRFNPLIPREAQRLEDSVLGSQLLPRRAFGNEKESGVDFSGLGGPGGQLSPGALWVLDERNADGARFVRDRVRLDFARNLPTLAGERQGVLGHSDALERGFEDMYRLIWNHREEWLQPGGLIDLFTQDQIRPVLLPTALFALLLRESLHPDMLRDALDREAFFDKLWKLEQEGSAIGVIQRGARQGLRRSDIPIFTASAGSSTLGVDGQYEVPDFFEETGIGRVRQRMEAMSERDLDLQMWLIRASVAILDIEFDRPGIQNHRYPVAASIPDRSIPESCLALARRIGDRLEHLTCEGEVSTYWTGIKLSPQGHWSVSMLRADFGEGLPGLALFLGYLGALTGAHRYTRLARRAWAEAEQLVHTVRERNLDRPLGALTGWGGIIYASAALGELWDRPDLVESALSDYRALEERIAADDEFIVAHGTAGLALGLAAVDALRPGDERVRSLMRRCGEQLERGAIRMPGGLGWSTPRISVPLTGFLHGAAGVAVAAGRIGAALGDERFLDLAAGAVGYERSLFSPEVRNWPDLRTDLNYAPWKDRNGAGKRTGDGAPPPPEQRRYSVLWCHGAPGIVLSRLRLRVILQDPTLDLEIADGIETTRQKGFGWNHSLCHGDMGNLEVFVSAAEVLGGTVAQHLQRTPINTILSCIDEKGCITGLPKGIETPGLFMGISGIGYQLLRLARPDAVPSVLTFEPPLRPARKGATSLDASAGVRCA